MTRYGFQPVYAVPEAYLCFHTCSQVQLLKLWNSKTTVKKWTHRTLWQGFRMIKCIHFCDSRSFHDAAVCVCRKNESSLMQN